VGTSGIKMNRVTAVLTSLMKKIGRSGRVHTSLCLGFNTLPNICINYHKFHIHFISITHFVQSDIPGWRFLTSDPWQEHLGLRDKSNRRLEKTA
jgi:hypothetical protein